jgi:hypothetical protein
LYQHLIGINYFLALTVSLFCLEIRCFTEDHDLDELPEQEKTRQKVDPYLNEVPMKRIYDRMNTLRRCQVGVARSDSELQERVDGDCRDVDFTLMLINEFNLLVIVDNLSFADTNYFFLGKVHLPLKLLLLNLFDTVPA